METTKVIKYFWTKGDNQSNLALLDTAINGLENILEAAEREREEKRAKRLSIPDYQERIKKLKTLLVEEYEYYEKSRHLPYWFRTYSVDRIRKYEREIDRIDFTIKILSGQKTGLSIEAIRAAKEYPMGNLIKLNGGDFALCPFHQEKTPSFKVFKDNGWKCFGCSEAGDVIDFVMRKEGLSFAEAVKKLTR